MSSEFHLLQNLAHMVNDLKALRVQTITSEAVGSSGTRDKESQLLGFLIETPAKTEREIALLLTGENALGKNYRAIRSRLKERLLNTLTHLDLGRAGFSEFTRSKYANDLDVFQSRTLQWLWHNNIAVQIARKALKQAEKYELTGNAIALSMLLSSAYSFRGDEMEVAKLARRRRVLSKLYADEIEANTLYDALAAHHIANAISTEPSASLDKAAYEKIATIFERSPRFTIGISCYRARPLWLQNANRYAEATKACQECPHSLSDTPT